MLIYKIKINREVIFEKNSFCIFELNPKWTPKKSDPIRVQGIIRDNKVTIKMINA